MVTMTCREMGGMCDEPVSGESKDELLANGMAHLEVAHPDMAATIKATPMDDPKMVEWSKDFDAKYEQKLKAA